MLFMIIERFTDRDPKPIGERFMQRGRQGRYLSCELGRSRVLSVLSNHGSRRSRIAESLDLRVG
jgi:hypothetical protein